MLIAFKILCCVGIIILGFQGRLGRWLRWAKHRITDNYQRNRQQEIRDETYRHVKVRKML